MNEPFVFSDPVVASKYEPTFGVDKVVIVPCVYTGKLSNINYAGAYKLMKWGDNQLQPLNPDQELEEPSEDQQ